MRVLLSLFTLCLCLLFTSAHAKDWIYVVSKGDNLWSISKKHLNKVSYYEDVRKINNITHPKRIPPGTLIRIPLDWVKRHAASVKVKFTEGSHQIFRDEKVLPVQLDSELKLGDELRLDGKGSITLLFADGTEMTLSDNVIISFDHLTQYGKTGMVDSRVRINQGKMEIRAEKQQGAGSRLDIASASAVTSVRGTVFRVGIDAEDPNASLVEVVEGEVAVEQEGQSVSVPQGFGLKIEKGKPITTPVKLLPAVNMVNLPKIVTNPEFELRWSHLNNSKQYQVQLATDKLFSSLIWQQLVSNNHASLPELDDNHYFVRVTAFDQEGIEGRPTEQSFELNIKPLAPDLSSIETIFINKPEPLTWRHQQDNAQTLIEISQDANFDNNHIAEVVSENSYSLPQNLPLGQYYWRAATVEDSVKGKTGPFSAPRQFLLTLDLPAPKLQGKIKEQAIMISMLNPSQEQSIEYQLAPTPEFNSVESLTLQANAPLRMPENSLSVQYIRARVHLTDHQVKSNWSRHCKVSEQQYVVCGI